ncbi:MAG: cytochrome b5 domain-containing protein [archaeon]|jgi:hypothetical protein
MNEKEMFLIMIIGLTFLLGGCTQGGTSNNQFYTLAEVALHNTPTDCWIVRDGNVYNITPLLVNSPNNFMIQSCGKEVTNSIQRPLTRQDFNSQVRDTNMPRPDFNGAQRDFNSIRIDQNFPRQGGTRQGREFEQYYIGRVA